METTKELKTLLIIMIRIDNTVTDLLLPLSILVFHFIRLLSQHFHKSSKKENKYSSKKTYPFSFKCPVSSLKSFHKFSCQLVKLKLIYFRPHQHIFFWNLPRDMTQKCRLIVHWTSRFCCQASNFSFSLAYGANRLKI